MVQLPCECMAKILEKNRAQTLRREGVSINHIAKTLSVSKGTVSYWCRDISLSPKQIMDMQHRVHTQAVTALLRSSEEKRARRIRDTAESTKVGKSDVRKLSVRDRFMVGLGLYWGEGYKRGNEELGFTNSDPEMILFFIKWLKDVYNIERDRLIARVSINASHLKREDAVAQFWSKKTSIPISQFTRTSFIKTQSKKVYPNAAEHFGTLRIKVRRGAALRRRILGSLGSLR